MDVDWLEAQALRYVAQWAASEAGVTRQLERKIAQRCERTGESPNLIRQEIPTLIAQLVKRNYVNDRHFAESSLERQRRRGTSAMRIRANLLGKGLSDSLLDTLFAGEAPEVERRAAWTFAKRRRLGPYCPKRREEFRDKHLGAFGRAGFEFDLAEQIVDSVDVEEHPESPE